MKVGELFAVLGLQVDKGSFEAGEKLINGVKTALEAFAIYKGVQSLVKVIQNVADTADQASKSANKLGLTTEAFQEYSHVADLSDLSTQQLSSSMIKLTRNLEDGKKKGTGPLVDGLKKLGLSLKDPAFASGDVGEAMTAITEKFSELPEGVNKATLATELFGKQGTSLIPLLESGREGFAQMREEAHTLGLVIDGDVAKSFGDWNDDVTRIKAAVQGFKNDAVVLLLPVLHEVATAVFGWLKANREWLKAKIQQAMQLLLEVFRGLVAAGQRLYPVFEKVADAAREVLIAFGEIVSSAGGLESGVTAAALAITAVWAIANLPILAMIVGITALILIVNSLWRGFEGKDSVLKDLHDSAEKHLGETGVGRVVLWLIDQFDKLGKRIEDTFGLLNKYGRYLGNAAFVLLNGGEEEGVRNAKNDQQFIESMKARGASMFEIHSALARGDHLKARGIDRVEFEKPGIDRVEGARPSLRGFVTPSSAIEPIDLGVPRAPYLHKPVFGVEQPNGTSIVVNPSVTIQGDADERTVDKIERVMRELWTSSVRDVAVATNANGGRLP